MILEKVLSWSQSLSHLVYPNKWYIFRGVRIRLGCKEQQQQKKHQIVMAWTRHKFLSFSCSILLLYHVVPAFPKTTRRPRCSLNLEAVIIKFIFQPRGKAKGEKDNDPPFKVTFFTSPCLELRWPKDLTYLQGNMGNVTCIPGGHMSC